eukprot:Plantae.Rhodophyta-Hildenbrandia_rubra.ctg11053.p1 GENE.Plantae.Rhodophyta-Hildenbrandia_rubra.ctg11053~~Plantae.Rhodophyta-Hildenbrandia_rubra.ctg11053.p1  ORF type:complete len:328 (-),score=39.50 Plantae.Rhodophyta-Hildenbrandia_rubra.ctg11053:2529-3512(-)
MSTTSRVEAMRQDANQLYHTKKFRAALAKYTQAISLAPSNEVLYSNRCACYLELKKYSLALNDAKRCVELKPRWAKGWGRLATSFAKLQELVEAKQAIDKAIELEPTNEGIKKMKEGLDGLWKEKEALLGSNFIPIDDNPYTKMIKKYEGTPMDPSSAKARLWTVESMVREALTRVDHLLENIPQSTSGVISSTQLPPSYWSTLHFAIERVSNAVLTDFTMVAYTGERIQKFEILLEMVRGLSNSDDDYCRPAEIEVPRYKQFIRGNIPKPFVTGTNTWEFVRTRLSVDIRSAIIYAGFKATASDFVQALKATQRAISLSELSRVEL